MSYSRSVNGRDEQRKTAQSALLRSAEVAEKPRVEERELEGVGGLN